MTEPKTLTEIDMETIARLESDKARLVEALRPFAIEKPIGIPVFWQKDFDNAYIVLAEMEKSNG